MNSTTRISDSYALYRTHLFLGLFLVAVAALLGSCQQEDGKELGLLPSAKGGRGEIILVMDSALWEGALGDAVREVFSAPTPGLPRPQPLFTLRYIRPHLFSGLLKQHVNIVTVTTFDSQSYGSRLLQSYFTPESVEIVRTGERFEQLKRDEYAKGQVVYRFFATEQQALITHLTQQKEAIQQFFNDEEHKRAQADVLSVAGNTSIENMLKTNHNFTNHIPPGFQLVKDTVGFTWLRHPEAKIDRNIFFAYRPYTSETQFEAEQIIAWRDSIARQYIYGDPANLNSYMLTESLEPMRTKTMDFNGKYAVECRGLWRTKNISMGGPFLSYVFLDESQSRLYYIEAFVFSPAVKQREIVRELEVVLRSFKG